MFLPFKFITVIYTEERHLCTPSLRVRDALVKWLCNACPQSPSQALPASLLFYPVTPALSLHSCTLTQPLCTRPLLHAVIFPATLLGTGQDWTLMQSISVTEYLNYEGGKFSKSRGTGEHGDLLL